MSATTDARLRRVCALLVGVTLLSWWLGARHDGQLYVLDAGVTLAVLLIAALKVRLIIWEFMELRHAPAAMRRLADAMLALLMATLLGVYGFGVPAATT